eukprot:gnl/TRDRNA2_/TRDRNA2_101852_c1_seq1.p1 gnl/TRDRNA2_/TRDRNA2_101852_c1~~gnl/TRDRNA2_/TRDRNA2_101852_c1_seq1.p1  ORF type:complete len:190 (-),score=24.86 gnl/TRDRNA2_/TRDRNA2_101852_c1_seq1:26-595(-)
MFLATILAIVAVMIYKLELYAYIVHSIGCMYGGQLGYVLTAFDLDDMRRNINERNSKPMLASPTTFCQSPIGLLHVVLLYAAAFVLIFLCMSCVPNEEVPILTKAGFNSIYIYLAHIWFAMIPAHAAAYGLSKLGVVLDPWASISIVLTLAVLFWACLAQQWLRCLCGPCVEPDVEACCVFRERCRPAL